jgi:DNA-binding NarL/FixJ family response regulator
MRHPQLLILRGDSRLTSLLEESAEVARWSIRKPHGLADCLELLPRADPNVLVLRVGRDLEDELSTVATIHRQFPSTAIIVVGDAEQSAITGIAWDLGARFVLMPPQSRDLLPAVVAGFMASDVRGGR